MAAGVAVRVPAGWQAATTQVRQTRRWRAERMRAREAYLVWGRLRRRRIVRRRVPGAMAQQPMAEREPSQSKTYALLAALIALGALLGLVVVPRIAPGLDAMVSKPAPDFALPVVANGDDGARMKLSELRDKVVVLDFWASWCGPCAMQAPILERVARRHESDLVVLGINVDDPPALAKRYAEAKGLSYPILADLQGDAQQAYDATTLPTLVIIDRQGNVRHVVRGVMRESALEQAIRSL